MHMTAPVAASLVALAAATSVGATAITPRGPCGANNISVQCCNKVQSAQKATSALLRAVLGITLQNTNVLMGLDCVPISPAEYQNGKCSGYVETVCCENSSNGGIVSMGCFPLTL
ncbi:Fruiting body protein SC3 [Trametes pubescens]|uniref:Hydrophobin n=1 Tax=Trametes pubescens TaxID=154538 RepID=A0A1M2VHI2_TRAPU|nr:Fruiting body protein SC3 [Trametes pubescens]